MSRRKLIAAVLPLTLVIAACGGGGSDDSSNDGDGAREVTDSSTTNTLSFDGEELQRCTAGTDYVVSRQFYAAIPCDEAYEKGFAIAEDLNPDGFRDENNPGPDFTDHCWDLQATIRSEPEDRKYYPSQEEYITALATDVCPGDLDRITFDREGEDPGADEASDGVPEKDVNPGYFTLVQKEQLGDLEFSPVADARIESDIAYFEVLSAATVTEGNVPGFTWNTIPEGSVAYVLEYRTSALENQGEGVSQRTEKGEYPFDPGWASGPYIVLVADDSTESTMIVTGSDGSRQELDLIEIAESA